MRRKLYRCSKAVKGECPDKECYAHKPHDHRGFRNNKWRTCIRGVRRCVPLRGKR